MNPPPPKVEMIESSLRCFRLGLLGLLPVIGIPMAIRSLLLHRRVKRSQTGDWNPAHRYLRWGAICARMGLVLFLFIPLAIAALELSH